MMELMVSERLTLMVVIAFDENSQFPEKVSISVYSYCQIYKPKNNVE
jgi:hypothetical protein